MTKEMRQVDLDEAVKSMCLCEGKKRVYGVFEISKYDNIIRLGEAVAFYVEDVDNMRNVQPLVWLHGAVQRDSVYGLRRSGIVEDKE